MSIIICYKCDKRVDSDYEEYYLKDDIEICESCKEDE